MGMLVGMFTSAEICDWIFNPMKRPRGKNIALCRACGKMELVTGKKPPACPGQSLVERTELKDTPSE